MISGFKPFYDAVSVLQNSNNGELTAGMPVKRFEETFIKYLTQAEIERFFSVIESPRDRALFGTIYHYGLRVSEATVLSVHSIDFNRQTIYIHRLKGGRSGQKPLLANTARLLKVYLPVRESTGERLFTGREGTLGRHRIGQLFLHYANRVGISGYSVHSLRHSIATHMLGAGFSIEVVQDHLGHRNIQSTLIYAQMTDEPRRKAFAQLEKSPLIVKF